MNYQQQIIDFLSKPENLPIALEVARHIEPMRLNLHESFWKEISKALKTRLKNSSLKDRWVFNYEGPEVDADYLGCYFTPREIQRSHSGNFLGVGLEQSNLREKFRLYYGLHWDEKPYDASGLKLYETLIQRAVDAGVSNDKPTNWWPAISYLDIYLRSDEFMLQYGLDPINYIRGLADRIWASFKIVEPVLYEFNQELFKNKAQSKKLVAKKILK